MMRILIDTNVALDILLHRQDYYDNAKKIYLLAERKLISCHISASAITDIFYLSKKDLGKKGAKEALKELLQVFKPATVTDQHIYHALDLEWSDFEDSVQYVVGESFLADYIVTRNAQDYSFGTIPVLTPAQFVNKSIVVE